MIKSVVFDIDGCLIDPTYSYTVPLDRLCRIIERGKKQRISFGVNSNRSFQDIMKIYDELGFNGVAIGECGAFMYIPQTQETQSFFSCEFNRQKLQDVLKGLGNVTFDNTNNLSAIRDEQRWICCEKTRKYTMTVYPRIGGVFSEEFWQETTKRLAFAYPEYDLTVSRAYGNILLTPKTLEKGSLLDRLEKSIASFGDSEQDISMFLRSDYCGAPQNAEEGVKEQVRNLGGFVAERSYTAGAYDFIAKIMGVEQ